MNATDRYIARVLAGVFATREESQRLESDLRAHLAEAASRGETPAQALAALGPADDVAAAFNAERTIVPAGFWQRLLAFAGDAGLLFLLVSPCVGAALLVAGRWPADEVPATGLVLLGLLGAAVAGVFIFYFPLLEWRFGATLGKHLLRLRVVREGGAPIDLGRAFVRRLSFYFELLWIDALFILFTEKKQRALDVVAKTLVAREPGQEAPLGAYLLCLALPAASLAGLLALVALCAPA